MWMIEIIYNTKLTECREFKEPIISALEKSVDYRSVILEEHLELSNLII